jgi:hypothetical protein
MVACEQEGTMTASTLSTSAIAAPGRSYLGRILVGSALMFVVLQGGLNLLFPHLDLTWSSLIVTAAMLAVAFAIEGLAFDRTPRQALAALGFGRPKRPPRAVLTY